MEFYDSDGISTEVDEETNIVSAKCLRCICVAESDCNINLKCDDSVCGPYKITLGFWIDAGRPTVKDNDYYVEDYEYRNCSNDMKCSARAIEAYMQRYAKDCNGDGEINCDDFIRIHHNGPLGCTKSLPENVKKAYEECMQQQG
ncbi:invertebrate-type lysozyme 6-like [Belonocnema kinseyi]|uniref:invertebrate-type lysozyme 6-like n=1 Tax=Belonocnema kinseyi TaxID=2817044 RepID=UPI00143DF985|nr:invertebrate-type lysozyme 6-like [Belonocnema kinseyi]